MNPNIPLVLIDATIIMIVLVIDIVVNGNGAKEILTAAAVTLMRQETRWVQTDAIQKMIAKELGPVVNGNGAKEIPTVD